MYRNRILWLSVGIIVGATAILVATLFEDGAKGSVTHAATGILNATAIQILTETEVRPLSDP
jgi:hypothetical protein